MTKHMMVVEGSVGEFERALDRRVREGWTLHSWHVAGDAPRREFYALLTREEPEAAQ